MCPHEGKHTFGSEFPRWSTTAHPERNSDIMTTNRFLTSASHRKLNLPPKDRTDADLGGREAVENDALPLRNWR